MKKMVYTACARSVFGAGKGFQIYTLSKGFTEEERRAAVAYINGYSFAEGVADSPVRNVYTRDKQLGYVYAQTKPAGTDWSSGRGGNFIGQALIDTGTNNILPIGVFGITQLFGGPLTKEEATGVVAPQYLPNFNSLPAVKQDYSKLKGFWEDKQQRESAILVAEAVAEALCGGKRVLLCDAPEHIVPWIKRVTSLFPPSIARMITFDTYCYDPDSASETLVCTLSSGTNYRAETFRRSERYVLFDFVSKLTTYRSRNAFYWRYLSMLKDVSRLEELHNLCEHELQHTASKPAVGSFLDDMAKLHYFLHGDFDALFSASAVAKPDPRRDKVVEMCAPLAKYYSDELILQAEQRVTHFVGLSSSASVAMALTTVFYSEEVHKAHQNSIDNLNCVFLDMVLERYGTHAMINYYREACSKLPSVPLNLTMHLAKLLMDHPEFTDAATHEDMDVFLHLIQNTDEYYAKVYQHVSRYLQAHLSANELRYVASYLQSEYKRMPQHFHIMFAMYKKLFCSIVPNCILRNDGLFGEIKRECQAIGVLCQKYGRTAGGTFSKANDLELSCADAVLAHLPQDESAQRMVCHRLIEWLGSGNDLDVYHKIFRSEVSDSIKNSIEDIYLRAVYRRADSLDKQGNSNAKVQMYNQARMNEEQQRKLFDIAIAEEIDVDACVDFARVPNNRLLNDPTVRSIFANSVMGQWLVRSQGSKDYSVYSNIVKDNLKRLQNDVKPREQGERERILLYFGQTIFEAAVKCPEAMLKDERLREFYFGKKMREIVSPDNELYVGTLLWRELCQVNAKTDGEGISSKLQAALKEEKRLVGEQWRNPDIPAALHEVAAQRELRFTKEFCDWLASRYALEFFDLVEQPEEQPERGRGLAEFGFKRASKQKDKESESSEQQSSPVGFGNASVPCREFFGNSGADRQVGVQPQDPQQWDVQPQYVQQGGVSPRQAEQPVAYVQPPEPPANARAKRFGRGNVEQSQVAAVSADELLEKLANELNTSNKAKVCVECFADLQRNNLLQNTRLRNVFAAVLLGNWLKDPHSETEQQCRDYTQKQLNDLQNACAELGDSGDDVLLYFGQIAFEKAVMAPKILEEDPGLRNFFITHQSVFERDNDLWVGILLCDIFCTVDVKRAKKTSAELQSRLNSVLPMHDSKGWGNDNIPNAVRTIASRRDITITKELSTSLENRYGIVLTPKR